MPHTPPGAPVVTAVGAATDCLDLLRTEGAALATSTGADFAAGGAEADPWRIGEVSRGGGATDEEAEAEPCSGKDSR